MYSYTIEFQHENWGVISLTLTAQDRPQAVAKFRALLQAERFRALLVAEPLSILSIKVHKGR